MEGGVPSGTSSAGNDGRNIDGSSSSNSGAAAPETGSFKTVEDAAAAGIYHQLSPILYC